MVLVSLIFMKACSANDPLGIFLVGRGVNHQYSGWSFTGDGKHMLFIGGKKAAVAGFKNTALALHFYLCAALQEIANLLDTRMGVGERPFPLFNGAHQNFQLLCTDGLRGNEAAIHCAAVVGGGIAGDFRFPNDPGRTGHYVSLVFILMKKILSV